MLIDQSICAVLEVPELVEPLTLLLDVASKFSCGFVIFLSPSPIVGFLLSLKVLAESAHMLSLIDFLDAVCSGNSCGESSSAVDYTTWASCCPTLPQIRKASRNFLTLTLHLMIEVDDILCC